MFLFALMLSLGCISAANAAPYAVITFDDLSGDVAVTNQYTSQGIDFTNTIELDAWNTAYAPVKYTGDHIAYTGYSSSATFDFSGDIDFFSSLVTSYNTNLYLEFYDSASSLVYSFSQYITLGTWQTMSADLSAYEVTSVVLHDTGNNFGFDDVTFDAPQSQVPEPSTMLLLGAGIGGFAIIRKRFKKA